MTDMMRIIVNCRLGGKIIKSFDFASPIPLDARRVLPPPRQELIDQAKTGLTDLRIAVPPYAGIEFEVVYR